MCKRCVELVHQYIPDLPDSELGGFLMGFTCYPFGDPVEHLEPQLKGIAERRERDGNREDWMFREQQWIDANYELCMLSVRDWGEEGIG